MCPPAPWLSPTRVPTPVTTTLQVPGRTLAAGYSFNELCLPQAWNQGFASTAGNGSLYQPPE